MPISVQYGKSSARHPRQAVSEFADQVGGMPEAILVFCSSGYDLDMLGEALHETFSCPVIACTSSGQIGADGFERAGLVGVGIRGEFRVRQFPIVPLADYAGKAAWIAEQARPARPSGTGSACC